MNIDNYQTLSSIVRHEKIEEVTLDPIQITYKDGLHQFALLVETDERVAQAYQNFMNHRETPLDNLPNEETLLYAGLDKFKKNIYLIVKNIDGTFRQNLFSILVYKIDENKLSTLHQWSFTYIEKEKVNRHGFLLILSEPDLPLIEVNWPKNAISIERVWNHLNLKLIFKNSNFNEQNNWFKDLSSLENISYANVDNFEKIGYQFRSIITCNKPNPITKIIKESLIFEFNHAFTTLLPVNIFHIRNPRYLSTKKAGNPVLS